MRVIGIDPGLYGAVAIVDGDGGARVWDMPVIKGAKKILDVSALYEIFDEVAYDTDYAIIEKQWAFPNQGGVSIFTLGHMVGVIEGYFVDYIPYEYVAPKVWQRCYGIVGEKNNTKAASYEIASKYYPHVELMTQKGKILDGRCDALLIARWGLIHRDLGGK